MTPFTFYSPVRIIFGRGCVTQIGVHAARYGRRALVVCGRESARRSNALERATDSLRAAGLAVDVVDGFDRDPTVDDVDHAAAAASEFRATVIVGIGGGSIMDVAKAAAVTSGRSARELLGEPQLDVTDPLATLAVPTTIGSGAEVTRGAIIADPPRGLRAGIRGDEVFPKVAFVDPNLVETIPFAVAAEGVFDMLTHLLESYIARAASPLTDAVAEYGLRLWTRTFDGLSRQAPTPQEWDALCAIGTMGGINVATASTCLPHRLQQALGRAPVHLSHGRGLAILYPGWIRLTYPFTAPKFDRAAQILGGKPLEEAIRDIIAKLGLDGRLSDFGFTHDDINRMVERVTGNVENDPGSPVSEDTMRQIYEEAFHQTTFSNATAT